MFYTLCGGTGGGMILQENSENGLGGSEIGVYRINGVGEDMGVLQWIGVG